MIGTNEYYGWYNPDFIRLESFFARSNPDKPVIVTETGAGCRGRPEEMFTEEYADRAYYSVLKMGKQEYIYRPEHPGAN